MEKQSFFKPFKSIFSLLLSICIVFCGLATTAFAAEADETTVLVEGQVYTLPVGSYTFNPTQDGWYKFESTNGGDPFVRLIINDGSMDSYENDDGGIDVNFKCFVDITSSDVVTIELSNYEADDTTPITFSIEYEGVDEPDDMGDPDDEYNDDYDGDATYVSANGFTAQVIDETTCRITNIEDSAVVDGVLTIPQAIEDYTVVGFDYWIDLYNGSITVINLPSTVSGDLPFDSLYNLTAVNVPEDSTSFKSINGVVYNKALTEVVFIPNDFSGVFYIPAGVETFDYTNLNVTGFEIEQGNKYFSMKNGILCNLDGTVLRKATPSAPTEFVLKANMFVEPACFAGSKLQKVTIDSNVTNISYAVFAGCTELKSVVIPGSVKAIGSSAFSGCTKLETVTINNGPTTIGSYAFQDCKALKSIVIPNSVKTIENKAFDCCSSLASATLGSGLKKICFRAFANCDSLLSIVIPNSVTEIEYGVFESCDKLATVKIGTGLKEITGGAFYGCKSLKSLSISNSVTTIEYEAFDGCTSLASVKIPDSVKNICYRAFADCTALASISIGKGVTYIDEGAFANTKYYNTSSNWVQKVLYIGNYLIEAKDDISGAYSIKNGTKCIATAAFSDCGTLKTVTMPSTLVSICDNAFTNCKTLTKAIIPASVKILGNYIFTGCKSLKIVSDKDTTSEVVTTPKSVTTITYGEFMGCESVKKVVIPYGVKAISPFAFSGCKSLTSITIPSSVKTIGYSSFDDCNSLKKVTIPSSVTEIAYRSFGYVYSYDEHSTTISKVAGFTIEGKKGSSAEQYAKENGFNFVERKLTLATPTASSANTSKGIKVTWNKVSNAETYAVYQRVYNAKTKKWGGWKQLKITTGLSYVDTTTKIGTYYSYAVRAVNDTFKSSFKATKGLKYDVKPVVTVANAANGIKVSWSTVANATGYTVYSSTYNAKTKKWSGWKNRGTAKATATYWVDKKAKAGTYYKYTVRAVYGSALTSYQASANVIRLLNPTVKVAKASNGIKVTWNKIAGAKNYKVYRATYANGKWSGWSVIATTNNKTIALTDKSAKKGVVYKYTVRAVNGKNASAFTASSNIKR